MLGATAYSASTARIIFSYPSTSNGTEVDPFQTVPTTAQYAAALEVVKADTEYKESEKDAVDLGEMVGKQILPYWNDLRLGWLF